MEAAQPAPQAHPTVAGGEGLGARGGGSRRPPVPEPRRQHERGEEGAGDREEAHDRSEDEADDRSEDEAHDRSEEAADDRSEEEAHDRSEDEAIDRLRDDQALATPDLPDLDASDEAPTVSPAVLMRRDVPSGPATTCQMIRDAACCAVELDCQLSKDSAATTVNARTSPHDSCRIEDAAIAREVMRSRRAFLSSVALLASTAACGPTAREIRAAREAQYDAPREEVMRLAADAVGGSYPVASVDDEAGLIVTETSMYEPDGSRVGKATNERDRRAGMNVRSEAGAVTLGFRVIVVGEAPPFQVIVEPIAQEIRANYSGAYTYLPDDPAMPGWINGKVDNLQLDVHRRLARSIKPSAVAQR